MTDIKHPTDGIWKLPFYTTSWICFSNGEPIGFWQRQPTTKDLAAVDARRHIFTADAKRRFMSCFTTSGPDFWEGISFKLDNKSGDFVPAPTRSSEGTGCTVRDLSSLNIIEKTSTPVFPKGAFTETTPFPKEPESDASSSSLLAIGGIVAGLLTSSVLKNIRTKAKKEEVKEELKVQEKMELVV